MAKDSYQDILDAADKPGGTSGTLQGDRRLPPQQPIPRPKMGWPWTAPVQPDPKFPSKAPAGMANQVKGDIGMYRQQEAKKIFGSAFPGNKLPGHDRINQLKYRAPETAIDAKFGPGDKVC